jgi:hypothetical protein
VIFVVIVLMLALVWYTIKASRPNVTRAAAAPPLTRFELHICPGEFHISYVDVESLTIGDRELHLRFEESASRAGVLPTQIDALIASNFILKAPAPTPELAFTEHAMQRDSIHIRIRYAGQPTWQAVFAPDRLPPNVNALIDGVRKLAVDFAQRASAPAPEASPALDTAIARVRVDLSGAIYFEGARVSLNELTHELNRFPRNADGEVWYHREADWQEEASFEVDATSHAVLERLLQQGLLVRVFGKDFDG